MALLPTGNGSDCDEDRVRNYSEQRYAEADDELRAEDRAELEGIMATAMLSQLGLES